MPVSLEASPAESALRQHTIPALRRLKLEERGDLIVLTGRVSSYYLKQLAQEAVLPLVSDRKLHNRVEVVRE